LYGAMRAIEIAYQNTQLVVGMD
ncbi:hypothetical protein A2U01_0102618, partial [Trifolium medium]|nr:hypothetical protein [Trifolium medium]